MEVTGHGSSRRPPTVLPESRSTHSSPSLGRGKDRVPDSGPQQGPSSVAGHHTSPRGRARAGWKRPPHGRQPQADRGSTTRSARRPRRLSSRACARRSVRRLSPSEGSPRRWPASQARLEHPAAPQDRPEHAVPDPAREPDALVRLALRSTTPSSNPGARGLVPEHVAAGVVDTPRASPSHRSRPNGPAPQLSR